MEDPIPQMRSWVMEAGLHKHLAQEMGGGKGGEGGSAHPGTGSHGANGEQIQG